MDPTSVEEYSQTLLTDCQEWRARYQGRSWIWRRNAVHDQHKRLVDRADALAVKISQQQGYEHVYAVIDPIRLILTTDPFPARLGPWQKPPDNNDELADTLSDYRRFLTMANVVLRITSTEGKLDLWEVREEVGPVIRRYEWCPAVQIHAQKVRARNWWPVDGHSVPALATGSANEVMAEIDDQYPQARGVAESQREKQQLFYDYARACMVEDLCVALGLQASAKVAKALLSRLYGIQHIASFASFSRARSVADSWFWKLEDATSSPDCTEVVV